MQRLTTFLKKASAQIQTPLESLNKLIDDLHKIQFIQESRQSAISQPKSQEIPTTKSILVNEIPIKSPQKKTNTGGTLLSFNQFLTKSAKKIMEKQQLAVEQVKEKLPNLQKSETSTKAKQQPKKNTQPEPQQNNFIKVETKQNTKIQAQKPKQQSQNKPHTKVQNTEPKKVSKRLTLKQFITQSVKIITEKQSSALKQVIDNLSTQNDTKNNSSQPQLKTIQKPENELSGQELQKIHRQSKLQAKPQNAKQIQENQEIDNFSFAGPSESPSKVQQAKEYCEELRQNYFNEAIYTETTLTAFYYQIVQVQNNNSYRCIQSAFQQLKSLYQANLSSKPKSIRKTSSIKNLDSGAEFNLELTMRSRLSKQSGTNIDRQDSLVYSNATSFGLGNARSKEVSRNNSSTRLPKLGQELDEIIHIQKASSKGEVDHTENDFSLKSISDTEPMAGKKNHQKKNGTHSAESKRSKTSREHNGQEADNDFLANDPAKPTGFINQQQDYEILPLTQESKPNHSLKKANINTFGMETPERPKKSFSIKTYSNNNKTENSRSIKKKSEDSVFSAEISQLESRISKIKETKLLRKMKLEEQLKKVNMEIQQLKIQQEEEQDVRRSHIKQKSSPGNSKEKSAFQSRVKVSDDVEEKKKAVQLVKNLRQQKMSRQNLKRNQHKAFNADLHQQMEDIMKMKYFNEERIKQKRQLEIIERMKQQEVRKIVEQRQKQESVEFLSKLKNGPTERLEKAESKVGLSKAKKVDEGTSRRTQPQESPIKKAELRKTEEREVIEPVSNPGLQKKKEYMKKMRNFTIIKKGREDLYEQALN